MTIHFNIEQINVFVRFFESINCLFLQIRWLEENLTRSSNGLLALVVGIIFFCLISLYIGESGLTSIFESIGIKNSDLVSHLVFQLIPLIIVVGIFIFFLYRRYQHNRINNNDEEFNRNSYNPATTIEDLDEESSHNQRRRPFDGIVAHATAIPSVPPILPISRGNTNNKYYR